MKKILFIINLLFFVTVFGDIPECALIKSNTGTKSVEQFSISEKIMSYKDGQFKDVPIKYIAKYKSKDFVVIQTSSGMLFCGKEAKVFSVSKNNFVKSIDLDTTDILLSSELKQYPVEKVVNCESEKENIFFILSLEEPHTFFQCDSSGTSFLMHNNPAVFVLEYVIERGPELIEIAASSVLASFGAKVAHDNGKHSHAFNEQRKAEIRQQHIEFLEDKVHFGKPTMEDYERLQLFKDFPGIPDEEVDEKIEANRKYRENTITLDKTQYEKLIKFLELSNKLKSESLTKNIENASNGVSASEKEPSDASNEQDDNKSDDKESGKADTEESKKTDKKESYGKDKENNDIVINQGKGKAPKVGPPNSIYEKVDNKDSVTVVSRTTYNSNGKIGSREDYYLGDKPHSHFDKQTNMHLKNHKHIYEYNQDGFIVNKYVEPI